MELYTILPRGFSANCYLLISSGDAVLVDPGANAKGILERIASLQASLRYILLTHAHFDHMGALREILRVFPVPLYLHESEADFPADPYKNASFLIDEKLRYPLPDRLLCGAEILPFGNETIQVIHTPGHTPGSSCFLIGNALLTGDTLFAFGVGRTDLYGGDEVVLRGSLQKLKTLPGELTIHPGHGSPSTLAEALKEAKNYFEFE